jgi:cell wall-associated NlpC family hydrolase
LKNLRPGDLVIYFPKATHVAMYMGRGKVIEAPRTGERIKISPIAAHPLLGAVRPDRRAPKGHGERHDRPQTARTRKGDDQPPATEAR